MKSILPTSKRSAVRANRLRGARRVAISIGTWPYLAAGACKSSSGIQCADATSVSCSSGIGAYGEVCKKTAGVVLVMSFRQYGQRRETYQTETGSSATASRGWS